MKLRSQQDSGTELTRPRGRHDDVRNTKTVGLAAMPRRKRKNSHEQYALLPESTWPERMSEYGYYFDLMDTLFVDGM